MPPSSDTVSPCMPGEASSVMFTTWSTVTMSLPELLLVALSAQVHATVTLLVNGDPVLLATFTLSTTDDVPPFAIAFIVVQVTICPLAMHDQPAVADPLNVSPGGNVSVTVTVPLLATDPAFETVMVNVSFTSFTVKVDGLWLFETIRSGNCVTVTISVFEVLLLVLPSVQVQATVPVLLRVGAAFTATFTFSVMVAVPPAAICVILTLFVQVTT